ncbi:MAG TPA: hypothetical protein VN731_10045 [Rhodanobacter sp.]|nr:hypothetical protein [Rhodanobacter sp.]
MSQNPIVPRPGGNASVLNITAATVVKAGPGTIFTVTNNVLGTASAGTIHDCLTTGAATASNLVGSIPLAVGVYSFTFPCATGIVVTPGTSQVLSVSYA